MRLLLLAALAALTGILAAFIPVLGLVSALFLVLGTIAALAIGLVLLARLALRRRVRATPLLYPAAVVLAGVVGLGVGYFTGPAPIPPPSLTASEQLAYMVRTDQGDRVNLRWLRLERDDARLARTKDLLAQGLVAGPKEMLDAALIFQHGADSTDYRTAHELALAAAAADSGLADWELRHANWLARAAYDRWMLSIGKPQKYGTQLGQ